MQIFCLVYLSCKHFKVIEKGQYQIFDHLGMYKFVFLTNEDLLHFSFA